jgi:hypothetical protein
VTSLIIGFIATVLIELPFARIQKDVMGRLKDRAKARAEIKIEKEMHDSLLSNE